MLKSSVATLILVALWLLMSGLWDKPLILIFGVISILITLYAVHRMIKADDEGLPFPVHPLKLFGYLCWLMVEIAKSNLAVTKVILSGEQPQRQKLLLTPATQAADINRVIYANSITLTPGTVTVETEDEQFLVHALDFGDGDRESLEDMDRRVTAIELSGALK